MLALFWRIWLISPKSMISPAQPVTDSFISVDCNVQSAVMLSAKVESEVKNEKSSSEFDLMYIVA